MHESRREEAVYAMPQVEVAPVIRGLSWLSRRLAVQLQSLSARVLRQPLQEKETAHPHGHQGLSDDASDKGLRLQAPLLRGAQGTVQDRSPALAQSQLASSLREFSRQAPSVAPRRDDLRLHAGGLDRGAGAVRLPMRVLQEHAEPNNGSKDRKT